MKKIRLKDNLLYISTWEEAMPDIKSESVDLIFFSPPYNVGIKYENYEDYMPWSQYWKWMENLFEECYRVLRPNRRIAVNVLLQVLDKNTKETIYSAVEVHKLLQKVGFNLNRWAIWPDNHRVKFSAWGSYMSAKCPYIYCPYEVIILASKGDWCREDKGVDTISKEDFIMGTSGVWNVGTARHPIHPAVFPEKLARLVINLLTYVGDVVLDPMAGVLTTAIAAEKLGRKWIVIEPSEIYAREGLKRLRIISTRLF